MRVLLASLVATAVLPAWSVTDVGTPPAHPGAFMIAKGINDAGAVIGDAWYGVGNRRSTGFVWRNGRMRALGYRDSTWTETWAVDARGDVAGDAVLGGGRRVAVVWPANGAAPVTLGTLGGKTATPVAINASGAVVGESLTADGKRHAFIWRAGTMSDLGTLHGGESFAVGINAKGQVIGNSDDRAFLWENGAMIELPTIGAFDSGAEAINDAGEVVGLVETHLGQAVEAVAWKSGRLVKLRAHARALAVDRAGDVLVELDKGGWDPSGAELLSHTGRVWTIGGLGGSPPPNQGGSLIVGGLNDAGQVFGYGYTKRHAGRRAFVWRNGKTAVLPTLDGVEPPWGAPARMNAQGAIAGTAYVSRGGENQQRVVVWRPR